MHLYRLVTRKWDLHRLEIPRRLPAISSHAPLALGPAARGGAPSAGAGVGVPAERIPRATPPNLARRGEIANKLKKTKKLGLFIKDCT
jgi:hypothetical protein